MSFGFSVGDFLAGAGLAYQLCQALSQTSGSAKEYQQLIAELNMVHKVFQQVDGLRASNQLAQATLNALSHVTHIANEHMESFLIKYEKYGESLKEGGSGHALKDSWRKGKWTFRMPEEVEKLRKNLSMLMSAANCLVQIACMKSSASNMAVRDLSVHRAYQSREEIENLSFGDLKIYWRFDTSNLARDEGRHDPNFQARVDPISFFRGGQVFAILVRLIKDIEQVSNEACLPTPKALVKKPLAEWKANQTALQTALDRLRQSIVDGNARKREALDIYWQKLCEAFVKASTADPNNGFLECKITNCTLKLRKSDSIDDYAYWDAHYKKNHPIAYSRIKRDTQEEAGPSPPEVHNDSPFISSYAGPVLVRRFIVIREGRSSCVCLPIHSHAGGGCAKQNDQDNYAIIYSSKDPPAPLEGETGMVLPPLRIKAEHPSTTLSPASRLYFGKFYEVSHDSPVWPLGLVHVDSIGPLMSIFEAASVPRPDPGGASQMNDAAEIEDSLLPVDETIANEIRESVAAVVESSSVPLTVQNDEDESPESLASLCGQF